VIYTPRLRAGVIKISIIVGQLVVGFEEPRDEVAGIVEAGGLLQEVFVLEFDAVGFPALLPNLAETLTHNEDDGLIDVLAGFG
jgi:hypothetical protein